MTSSQSSVAMLSLFGILFVMFTGAIIASCFLRSTRREPQAPPQGPEDETLPSLPVSTVQRIVPAALGPELESRWLQGSCLRVLPGADKLARSTASLFGALHERFDFQPDNVRNQFDHLMSLLRSHCSMVADRSVEEGVQVSESSLLVEALGDLHAELLEGFTGWRQKFSECKEAQMGEMTRGMPPLGGASWEPVAAGLCGGEEATAQELSRHLAEIAAYLLVWGEAGNIRFMPEVVYFITDIVLAANDPGAEGLYIVSAGSTTAAPSMSESHRSGLFLSKIIRPIYNVIFDEWYEYIDIDEKSKKDKKKLHQGYDRYLPPDVANYDDWDEFFCEPSRLVDGLLIKDGQRLFDRPHGQRYTSLPGVDWVVSLDRFETKTYREVHSLWGVWASSHRVWLTHLVIFLLGVCTVAGDPPRWQSEMPLLGFRAPVRFAAVGLTVPIHGVLWAFGRLETSGRGLARRMAGGTALYSVLWSLPIFTYAGVRYAEANEGWTIMGLACLEVLLVVHLVASVLGLSLQLLVPSRTPDRLWSITPVPLHLRLVRYIFWFVILSVKFLISLTIIGSMYETMESLGIVMLGKMIPRDIRTLYYSATWGAQVLEWMWLWSMTFFLYLADTQLWFVLACTFLGVATTLVQRSCRLLDFATEDAVAKIPERFSLKVLTYSSAGQSKDGSAQFSPYFPLLWDRVIEYMRYEDKFDSQALGDLSFRAGVGPGAIAWGQLGLPLTRPTRGVQSGSSSQQDQRGERRVKVPEIFRPKSMFERGFTHYCGIPDPAWPTNLEAQWRLIALSRSLGLPMPRPFRAPYIPGITVLIPHYGESIIMEKNELYSGQEENENRVPLMDWLQAQYEDEFRAFTSRMQACSSLEMWDIASSQWEDYMDHQWDKICPWASMRMQTLWRTVAGMTLYHPALQAHFEAQADRTASLAREDVWKPSDVFTCMVSMQMYAFFNAVQFKHTNKLFEKFPDSLQVAFIDHSSKNINAAVDGIHPHQRRRYFSCLIDGSSAALGDGRRQPRFRIELPGFPILGDGKGDNQNHAIPFMRGTFAQCIDSNQGAYFEQMLLLPCVLGEFRTKARRHWGSKRIIGLPEHITSDIGSVGDFAAGSEMAFGTILQRSYAVLGARMHYGHPDIMNKQFMMQQGGVSKATKTLNLSEDIFAGMDFTLRGEGRQIKHCEYFHLAKGRDLGFNSVLVFFSKLSSGAGEQILTRQMFRLGQVLHLPECLSFYYAHVGYYITQFLISWSMPIVVFTWLLVLTAGCEESFQGLHCSNQSAARTMAKTLSVWYSWILLFFLIATSLPLFAEVWLERTFGHAFVRLLKQFATGSPLHFIFQAKIIAYYVMNELRYGGATYMPTGRGLPTERRPFIGKVASGKRATMKTVGGLYLDYAMHAYYDGMLLLAGTVLVVCAGGAWESGLAMTWVSIGITIVSWLLAPFIFNPYQFSYRYFKKDLRGWFSFFFSEHGKHWIEWYDRQQLQPRTGFRHTVIDINFCLVYFFCAVWFATMNQKLTILSKFYTSSWYIVELYVLALIPPVVLPLLFCGLLTAAEVCGGCSGKVAQALGRGRGRLRRALARRKSDQGSEAGTDPCSSECSDDEATDEELPDFHRVSDDHTVVPEAMSEEDSDVDRGHCCPSGIPLVGVALIVSVLTYFEAILPLYVLKVHGFNNAFIAGLVLKFILYNVVLVLMEGVIRSRCFGAVGRLGHPLDLCVHANRMARDFLTSLFLLCTLAPLVLLNSLNEYACSGCSAHFLLIYRHPGHLARKVAVIDDLLEVASARDSDSSHMQDSEEMDQFFRRAEEGDAEEYPPPVPAPPLVSMPPTYSTSGAPVARLGPPSPVYRTAQLAR